jgi:uncharacterized protein
MKIFTRQRISTAVSAALLGLSIPLVGQAGKLSFQEVPVPEKMANLDEKRQVLASPKATVNGVEYDIGFNVVLRDGDTLVANKSNKWSDNVFGGIIGDNGEYIRQIDGSILNSRNSGMDHNSLIEAQGKLWLVSQFESRPGGVYVTELKQESDGHLYPLKTRPVDFSSVNGGWVHCAGSNTPWNTHLGSEEYEPDARQWMEMKKDPNSPIDSYNAAMVEYFTDAEGKNYAPTPENALQYMNPYDYGYAWELEILNGNGKTSVEKHYAMGRVAMELAYVMPDEKTVYMTDDGSNVGIFMFVADKEGDLSLGTLYAGKWIQKSDENGGEAKIRWVNLGSADADKIKSALDAKVQFDDMFETADPVGAGCPDGFTSTNSGHGSPYHECLKLTQYGAENLEVVSRLETRRYAAYMGATTEWRKMEGITFDAKRNKLYLAISEINKGMLDGDVDDPNSTYDVGGQNDIHVPENFCGGVYALKVKGGQKDLSKTAIQSNFVATNMKGLVMGSPVSEDENNDLNSPYYVNSDPSPDPDEHGKYAANSCHVDAIANPDNLTYIEFYNTLIVGEDSVKGHQNDTMWAYNVKQDKPTRIFTAPYGSETTSPYWYPNIGGYGYLLCVIQHPYGESDGSPEGVEQPKDRYIPGSLSDRAWVGYIGPFPPMD